MSAILESLEAALGRSIDREHRSTVPSFNDLPEDMVAEARQLGQQSRTAAAAYLQFYVVKADLDSVARFIEEFLATEATEGASWRTGDVRCIPRGDT